MLAANSVNVGASTFQFNSNGLVGVLFNGPVTVYVTSFTRFGGGLTSLQDLTSSPTNPLRVIGIVLKDPISSQPVFVARSVVSRRTKPLRFELKVHLNLSGHFDFLEWPLSIGVVPINRKSSR